MRKAVNLKRVMAILSVIVLIIFMPVTALADGIFAGDIIITNVVADYEYRIYEVLDIDSFAEDTYFRPTDNWKDFVQTNGSAAELLIPDGSGSYAINKEAGKETQRAFAKAVVEYADQNGIAPSASKRAEEGDTEISFSQVMLGVYVIDTAGRPRLTIMWDLEWRSEIKESYKPENNKIQQTATETNVNNETVEIPITDETKNVSESMVDNDEVQTETVGDKETVTPTAISETDTKKTDTVSPAIIVTAVVIVAVIAITVIVIFRKKR